MSSSVPDNRTTDSTANTLAGGGSHHHHHHHRARRLRHFLRPDGRHVHIAHSPEEVAKLRRHLEAGSEPFDLYIHGSPEHLEALREIHGYHERRREELRQKHGEVFDEFEKVRHELDGLSTELRMITEHGVALDANFSKYGYSAHLRTRVSPESSANASSSALSESSSSERNWDAEKKNGYAISFYKKPVVRQYFHKGLLWRAPESEEVASYELFVDLLYVGIIAINGDMAIEHPTGEVLLRFCISFILGWKIWTDYTLVVSWFESDDIVQRISTLFIMACLFGYTTNIFESGHNTYAMMIAFFLAARIFGALYFLWLFFVVPMIRPVLIGNIVLILIASALWIGSIHVEEPGRQGLIWVAIVLDLWGALSMIFLIRGTKHFSKRLGERMQKIFEFYPAINIEHKTERTNAFVALVFGYSVIVILYQNNAKNGFDAFYGKAVLGLMQAFAFNWIYFEIDGFNLYMHAIRRRVYSAIIWNSVLLPFIMGYVLGAGALSRMVLAHDAPNTDPHHLTHMFEERSAADIHDGIRWFYCTGLGVALACMGIISMSHVHKDIEGARLKKWHRLVFRFAVALVLICLPLQDSLNSLELVGLVTGLLWLDLIVELVGVSNVSDSFFDWRKKCTYTADCPLRKRDLEQALKKGEKITIEEVVADMDTPGEKGHFE